MLENDQRYLVEISQIKFRSEEVFILITSEKKDNLEVGRCSLVESDASHGSAGYNEGCAVSIIRKKILVKTVIRKKYK